MHFRKSRRDFPQSSTNIAMLNCEHKRRRYAGFSAQLIRKWELKSSVEIRENHCHTKSLSSNQCRVNFFSNIKILWNKMLLYLFNYEFMLPVFMFYQIASYCTFLYTKSTIQNNFVSSILPEWILSCIFKCWLLLK